MVKLNLDSSIIYEDMEHIYLSRDGWKELNHCSVYITGAAGMIASYFTMFLIYLVEKKKFDITIIAGVRKREKLEKRFGEYLDRNYFKVVEGDVSELTYEEIKPDYVIHAASFASPQYYGVYPVETMLPNIIGTNSLLQLMKRVNGKAMLFFSSGSVYGSVLKADSLKEDIVGSMKFLELGNSYGESKRCGEALCSAYFHEYGVPVKIARIHHTYGPSMDYENDKRVFSEFVKNIVNGEDIVMKSDGSAKRAFCYLSDMVTALYKILLDGESGLPYNVANEKEYVSIAELAEKLTKLYPQKGLSVIIQGKRNDEYCPSSEKRIVPVNCNRIEMLGWKPIVGVSEGFKRTIDFLDGARDE